MGQPAIQQQFFQFLQMMHPMSLNPQSCHHMSNHAAVIAADFPALIFVRLQIIGNAEFLRIVHLHTGTVICYLLRDGYMNLRTLSLPTLDMHEPAYGPKQPFGNGQPQTQPSVFPVVSGIRLIEVIAYPRELGA